MNSTRAFAAMVVSWGAVMAALGGDPRPRYDAVGRVLATDPQRFSQFWERGFSEHLRIAVFGDSQETSPGGEGSTYVPNLNRRLDEFFGHSGESILMSHWSVGGGSPPAGWLWRGAIAAPNGTASMLGSERLPPNIRPRAHRQKSAQTQSYGLLAMLLYDGSLTADPEMPIRPYFDPGNPWAVEILALTSPGSGGISYRIMPTPTNVASYFASSTGSGVLTPPLDSEDLEVVSVCTPRLDRAGLPYVQVEVWGSSLESSTEILGVRYLDLAEHRGATVQSIAAGGYLTRSFLANHGESGPILRGLGFDLIVIHTGCNDAAIGTPAEEYRDELLQLIAWLRLTLDDPNLPVIIVGDLYRTGLTAGQMHEYDRYPWAASTIAESDPDVMAVNLRRIVEEDLGWGASDSSFLRDPVHLTKAAQRQLAQVLVETLTAGATGQGNPADLDRNGVVDGGDVAILLAEWGVDGSPLDLTADGIVDAADLSLVLASWGWRGGSRP